MSNLLYNRVDIYVYRWVETMLTHKFEDGIPYEIVWIPTTQPSGDEPDGNLQYIKAYLLKLEYNSDVAEQSLAPLVRIMEKESSGDKGVKMFCIHAHRNPPQQFPLTAYFKEQTGGNLQGCQIIYDSFEYGSASKPLIARVNLESAVPVSGNPIVLTYHPDLLRVPVRQDEYLDAFYKRLSQLSNGSSEPQTQSDIWPQINASMLGANASGVNLEQLPKDGPAHKFHKAICNYISDKLPRMEDQSAAFLDFQVSIVYLSHRDWYKRDIVNTLTNRKTLLKCFPSNEDLAEDAKQYKSFQLYQPHIFLAIKDGMPGPERQADRLISHFMNSSIWTQLEYLDELDSVAQLGEKVLELIKKAPLFRKEPCLEFIEFNSRLLRNAFLSGRHKALIPFPFHDEKVMAAKAEETLKKILSTGSNAQYTWRCLLLDDHSLVSLADNRPDEEDKMDQASSVTPEDRDRVKKAMKADAWSKAEILSQLLEQYGIETFIHTDKSMCEGGPRESGEANQPKKRITIELCCAQTLGDAVEMIKSKCFDIILLDNLLGQNTQTKLITYHSGIELLEMIHAKKWASEEMSQTQETTNGGWKEEQVGPFGKFWIFGISSYQTTFVEQVRNMGLTLLSDQWNLFRGACPINTPQLFMQQFLNFLLIQLKEARGDMSGILRKLEEESLRILTLSVNESREMIRMSEDEKAEAFRIAATDIFGDLMYLVGKQERLKQDIQRGSGIAGSLNNSNFDEIVFTDHARQILYLISYGNGRQWEEMYQEYIILKSLFPIRGIDKTALNHFWKMADLYIHHLREQFETA